MSSLTYLITHFAAPCQGGDFLLFPKWYKYLNGQTVQNTTSGSTTCVPQISQLSDVWLIVAAMIELLLRVGALVALAFAIYGGFQYITSQGDPAKTAAARTTILNALTGLIIAVGAATLVTFIAGRFK